MQSYQVLKPLEISDTVAARKTVGTYELHYLERDPLVAKHHRAISCLGLHNTTYTAAVCLPTDRPIVGPILNFITQIGPWNMYSSIVSFSLHPISND